MDVSIDELTLLLAAVGTDASIAADDAASIAALATKFLATSGASGGKDEALVAAALQVWDAAPFPAHVELYSSLLALFAAALKRNRCAHKTTARRATQALALAQPGIVDRLPVEVVGVALDLQRTLLFNAPPPPLDVLLAGACAAMRRALRDLSSGASAADAARRDVIGGVVHAAVNLIVAACMAAGDRSQAAVGWTLPVVCGLLHPHALAFRQLMAIFSMHLADNATVATFGGLADCMDAALMPSAVGDAPPPACALVAACLSEQHSPALLELLRACASESDLEVHIGITVASLVLPWLVRAAVCEAPPPLDGEALQLYRSIAAASPQQPLPVAGASAGAAGSAETAFSDVVVDRWLKKLRPVEPRDALAGHGGVDSDVVIVDDEADDDDDDEVLAGSGAARPRPAATPACVGRLMEWLCDFVSLADPAPAAAAVGCIRACAHVASAADCTPSGWSVWERCAGGAEDAVVTVSARIAGDPSVSLSTTLLEPFKAQMERIRSIPWPAGRPDRLAAAVECVALAAGVLAGARSMRERCPSSASTTAASSSSSTGLAARVGDDAQTWELRATSMLGLALACCRALVTAAAVPESAASSAAGPADAAVPDGFCSAVGDLVCALLAGSGAAGATLVPRAGATAAAGMVAPDDDDDVCVPRTVPRVGAHASVAAVLEAATRVLLDGGSASGTSLVAPHAGPSFIKCAQALLKHARLTHAGIAAAASRARAERQDRKAARRKSGTAVAIAEDDDDADGGAEAAAAAPVGGLTAAEAVDDDIDPRYASSLVRGPAAARTAARAAAPAAAVADTMPPMWQSLVDAAADTGGADGEESMGAAAVASVTPARRPSAAAAAGAAPASGAAPPVDKRKLQKAVNHMSQQERDEMVAFLKAEGDKKKRR